MSPSSTRARRGVAKPVSEGTGTRLLSRPTPAPAPCAGLTWSDVTVAPVNTENEPGGRPGPGPRPLPRLQRDPRHPAGVTARS
jgi:hypothetical protein